MESILTSIKKLLGITEEYEHFDMDIIIHINSVLSILSQLGIGSPEGFIIENKTALWSDFISDNPDLGLVKTYVYFKVRMLFDPPLSSVVKDSINQVIGELEWRLQIKADPIPNGLGDNSK